MAVRQLLNLGAGCVFRCYFFFNCSCLLLLILALAEPVFSVRLSNIAIVMDNSASMQAQEDGTARIELARDAARVVLADLGANGKVDIFQIVPQSGEN